MTCNHFAFDVGGDHFDPRGAVDAFTVGMERRMDVAEVNGRVRRLWCDQPTLSNICSTRLMARGGYGKGSGVPLRDRIRLEQSVPAPSAPDASLCPARHCWVLAPADGTEPRPGLLVEWRRAEGSAGWSGRVLYLAQVRLGRWTVVEEWIPAELLRAP